MRRVAARAAVLASALWLPVGCGSEKTPAPPARSSAPAARPSPAATPLAGHDFVAEARLLQRVLACSGDEPLPTALDTRVVERHCQAMQPLLERYRERYLAIAAPFLAGLRPPDAPATLVYPFGGGDLLSALTTYPDALDITTLSLEQSGDPRRLRTLDAVRLERSLALLRTTIAPLLTLNDSTSANLMKGQRGELPGQLGFFVVALAVHGYEPRALRYFRVQPDGTLHYLSAADIEAGDDEQARSLKGTWTAPDFAPVFANAELSFAPRGAPAGAALRRHRHLAANLADDALRARPGLLRHLAGRGRVAAMTKAASYLLWRPDFSLLRGYLLEHMEVMISDSTGIAPSAARAAGFEHRTYGRFNGSFLPADGAINEQFRTLWRSQPERPQPVRYGYLDRTHRHHLLVTRRVGRAQAPR